MAVTLPNYRAPTIAKSMSRAELGSRYMQPRTAQAWPKPDPALGSPRALRVTRGYRDAMRFVKRPTSLCSALLSLLLMLLFINVFAGNLPAAGNPETIAPYRARFGRPRPVVAIVGLTRGTETTDYLIPYGVLTASEAAQVFALGTESGAIQLMPALKVEPQATVAEFDARFPEGADFVIVPAV